MDTDKVLQLAKLSRIKLAAGEAEALAGEFQAILNYVGEVKSVGTAGSTPTSADYPVRNVMREDGGAHDVEIPDYH